MKSWYSIKNQSDQLAELSIYDDIGAWGVSAKDFLADLKTAGDRKIKLRINSGGGNIFDAVAIHNLLKAHAPGVETFIDGVAASAATIVALGGQVVNMAQNALFMIHKSSGIEAGNAEALRDYADLLDKVDSTIVSTYQKKTGKTDEDIKSAMGKESWFTADEAKAFGFVDNITEPLQIAASFDMSRFREPPKATPAPSTQPENSMTLRSFLITALNLKETPEKLLADDAITAAFTAALTGERQEHKDAITALRAEHDATKGLLTTAQTNLTATEKKFTDLTALLKPALDLSDEQVTNIVSDKTVVATALDKVANKKAIQIAAGQGVPPVITDPNAGESDDEIKAAFETASKEPDPRKRGALFAAASARLEAKSKKAHGKN